METETPRPILAPEGNGHMRPLPLFAAIAGALIAMNSNTSADAPTLKPTDNLVTEGIPTIPLSLVEEIGRYIDFRAAVLHDWHPKKREMLIGTRFADTMQVHYVRAPGADRKQLTFYKDMVSGAVFEPAEGRFFVFSKDTGGNEFLQYYRFDLDTGNITLLTDGKSRNTDMVFSRDGRKIAYSSTARTGQDVDLWVLEPLDPASRRMVAELKGGGWFPMDWSMDGGKILVLEYLSINESNLWIVDAATGSRTRVTPEQGAEKVYYSESKFGPKGDTILVPTDRGSEFQRLCELSLSGEVLRVLTADVPWDVKAFDLSSDGSTLAFLTSEAGVSALRFADYATGKALRAPKLPTGVASGLRFRKGSREVGFAMASARSSYDVYSCAPGSQRLIRWTESETGGLNTAAFPDAELVRIKSFDGVEISGFLYRPPAKFRGPRPVIVEVHGGPESQSTPTFLGRRNYLLNEMGVALFLPNIRGSTGYGKTFVALDNGLKREDAYRDIESLLDWIGTRSDLDAKRVMITGGSYGGHVTLVVAYRYSDRIRCALAEVGMSSLVTFLKNTQGYRRDLRRAEYGDERDPKTLDFMERTAPVNNAEKIGKPLFVVQGANDPRVPLSEAEQIVKTLRDRGVPVWYLMAKDEGHGFAKKGNADFRFYATVLFIRQFLAGA